MTRNLTANDDHFLLYPPALEEKILFCLARDLRLVERLAFDGELDAPIAASLYLICDLLMRPGTSGHVRGELEMTESGFARAIKVLQNAVERQIVSRIVGIATPVDEDFFFLAKLDRSQTFKELLS